MEFKKFNELIKNQFEKMIQTNFLFVSSFNGSQVWKLYLESFENVKIFRDPSSNKHNCNTCHSFIKRYGNVVAIDQNYNIITLFDVEAEGEYKIPAKKVAESLRLSPITDVFVETFDNLNTLPYEKNIKKTQSVFRLGIASNIKRYTDEEADMYKVNDKRIVNTTDNYVFNHFHLDLPAKFVRTTDTRSIAAIEGELRDNKNVLERGMVEISYDTLELVCDLIKQGSLLDGTTHLAKVEAFKKLKKEYDKLSVDQAEKWCWLASLKLGMESRFKNNLIGVLCSDLSQGMELNKACELWNKRVDPVNYMKASAPITKKQIAEAQKFVEENGYEESFDRRFATIDDIKVDEIKHVNSGKSEVKKASIFDGIKSTATRHKKSEFDKVEEVSIEKFISDILPSCTSVEAFVKNSYDGNFVVLTTANNPESKRIFKWSNNYSWTYNGNLAGKSQIKEAVKTKGGKVDGVLRFSIMWADGDGDNSDLDAHCKEPNGHLIYYGDKVSHSTGGNLDIDIRTPEGKLAVENITYPYINKMKKGEYDFIVNQFSSRGSRGFKAEIEFNGETYSYEYNKPVNGKIPVATVIFDGSGFDIKHNLPEIGVSSKEIWGIETNSFQKVNLVCLSPNHWGDNSVGNKHYLFMLENAKPDVPMRSFHNENLSSDLLKHRKVMEVLGSTAMIDPTDKMLAGLGFNATVRDEIILRLSGNFKRVIKVKF